MRRADLGAPQHADLAVGQRAALHGLLGAREGKELRAFGDDQEGQELAALQGLPGAREAEAQGLAALRGAHDPPGGCCPSSPFPSLVPRSPTPPPSTPPSSLSLSLSIRSPSPSPSSRRSRPSCPSVLALDASRWPKRCTRKTCEAYLHRAGRRRTPTRGRHQRTGGWWRDTAL
jgi:hypothetical protein